MAVALPIAPGPVVLSEERRTPLVKALVSQSSEKQLLTTFHAQILEEKRFFLTVDLLQPCKNLHPVKFYRFDKLHKNRD